MTTPRLIETWMPIAAIGEESVRERRSMTALPPTYYLHVWWARRPLVASRAAILASLLPADADRELFLHALGIHGDPVAAIRVIDKARRSGLRIENPYGYDRAFKHNLNDRERQWLGEQWASLGLGNAPTVLDPTAGGGSIPFEAVRLGCTTITNDLNPVASMIERATVEWPLRHGGQLAVRFAELAATWRERLQAALSKFFPQSGTPDRTDTSYLWARTIRCPYCGGLIPLSPNWRLNGDGLGVRLQPDLSRRLCTFHIVTKLAEHSPGTVTDGDAQCPYADCGRLVANSEIKAQAQAHSMGEQLYAVVYKKRTIKATKSGKGREVSERGFRPPSPADDLSEAVANELRERMPEWEAMGCIPTERLPMDTESWTHGNTPAQYGARSFVDLFSPRQLLVHLVAAELYVKLTHEHRAAGTLDELSSAAFAYLASALDKIRDYNSIMTRWHSKREVVVNTFDRHDFGFKWSYCEMDPLISGLGFDWATEITRKCIDELVELLRPDVLSGKNRARRPGQAELMLGRPTLPSITVTNQSADALGTVAAASVDSIVMDPPYYDNVMYAELSDYFYVWLKRTAGIVSPDLFRRVLTDKESEAVANTARFEGQKNPRVLAAREYQDKMAAIFSECRRVLKPDGILTVMFTHKATGAWDALATGLLEAGFTVTASWPINTESEGSLHIKDKAAANSTIFLVCRPRPDRIGTDIRYWEDVEPLVGKAVRERIDSFEKAGIRRVDLYLSCFGPALEEFAKHWPLTRGQPRPAGAPGKRRKEVDADDPYAVTPEDALDAARREVKKWKLDKLLRTSRHADLDPMTEWFALAWDAFEAPEFPYDEALRLARVVGVDLDREIIGRLAEKKGGDVILWDSSRRAAKAALGPPDGSRSMIDALHNAAHKGRVVGLDAARSLLSDTSADQHPSFVAALTVLLEVLPVSSRFTEVAEEAGPVADAASDFDVLEQLRRLAYSEKVREPEQLGFWTRERAK